MFVGKTLLHGDVLMWLMKTLLTSGCTNQRGAGQLWLIETGCLSYSQLAEAYPWADDVFTGLSRPSGLSNSGGLPVSKAYLFAALYGTNDIFSRNTDISYTAITGRSPSPRYLRHVNSVLQATSVNMKKVLCDKGMME
ncbi:BMT2 family SAM-dependent methyltransferase [Enterobacter hormaechei subsp. xiangfangensis]|nr:BMT2 family SAM-dependent methyltransferase [Enterobacter hormaechei subsp. xiangfangensis]MCU2968471.1 BMT2 family SAM-dependent methyltransferase [Enterobacter hormaechei subsp. xiangfangensis]MCU3091504.1 BMT2 family SAM-dependent methyltransferase [Enterobacter hormaechei subsp. xiangfangensis]MCU3178518.1 BMT2 family SAM-dependent methyltransferase [Enterobacter hormaechei subsp. xiangfangensis]MCU3198277.1 BMT2 family SAM-dependent methyltransferase [Enterobacter hormaechei subsp. xian